MIASSNVPHLVGAGSGVRTDRTPHVSRPSLHLSIDRDDEDASFRSLASGPRRRTFAEYCDHVVASFSRGLRLFNLSPRSARVVALADGSNGEPDEGTRSPMFGSQWGPRRSLSSYVTPSGDTKELMRKKLWHIGAFILLAGSICTFVSFAYAPQSMLAALGSVQFLSNVFFARFVLSEEITLRVILATCIIIAGQVLIVVYSPHKTNNYDAHSLMSLYDRIFLTYMGILSIVGGGLIFTYRHFRRREAEGRELPHTDTVLPVTYAMSSAMVGTFSVLQAKCLSELLGRTLRGDNQLKFFFTWFVLFLWLFLTVFWLHRMNTALRLFDGVFIIPVLQVFWTLFAIMTGGIFFQEFQEYTPKMLGLFVVGVLTIFSGVVLLSPRQSTVEEEEFEEICDEEGASAWRGMAAEEESSTSSPKSPPSPPMGDGFDSPDEPVQGSKGDDGSGKGGGRQQQASRAPAHPDHPTRGTVAAVVDGDVPGEEGVEERQADLVGISLSSSQALDAEGEAAATAAAAAAAAGGGGGADAILASGGGGSPSKPRPPQIQSKSPTSTRGSTGSAAAAGHHRKRSSLEVLDKHNSCLFSINTMPFMTNDENLTHFLLDHVTPTLLSEDRTLPRSVRSSSRRTLSLGGGEEAGQARVVVDGVSTEFSLPRNTVTLASVSPLPSGGGSGGGEAASNSISIGETTSSVKPFDNSKRVTKKTDVVAAGAL